MLEANNMIFGTDVSVFCITFKMLVVAGDSGRKK